MSRLLYSAVFFALLPLLFLRLWLKGRKSPNYRKRWAERLGFFDVPEKHSGGICFHCVSVGESIAAIKLIKSIKSQYPTHPVTVTTTTPTGSAQIQSAFGNEVFHVYLPFDTPGAIKRFFNKIQPKVLVIIETELWPNLLHYAKKTQCKTILANARLSQRSAKGYQKVASLTEQMLTNLDIVAAHNIEDGQRFVELGLVPAKLAVTGSIKFDISSNPALVEQSIALKEQWAPNRPIWVVGSTHQGEDEAVLQAFAQILKQHPDTLLILVPRHPERFKQVEQLLIAQHISYTKRSTGQSPTPSTQVILGDTMGELNLFWAMADICFVGGSLVEHGGHNPLEPALFAKAILTGPHTYNFKQIYELMEAQGAVIVTPDWQMLGNSVIDLLNDTQRRQLLGMNAKQVLDRNRGALERLKSLIKPLLIV